MVEISECRRTGYARVLTRAEQLVDFGFAKTLRNLSHMKTQCGSPWWVSPPRAPNAAPAGPQAASIFCRGRGGFNAAAGRAITPGMKTGKLARLVKPEREGMSQERVGGSGRE